MQHIVLLSKLHRVTVTEADLHYEGSCGIDEDLLIAAKMHEFEKIELYNINNGERFSTYIIKAPKGSGVISLNGAAARRAHVGDHLIICTYGQIDQGEVSNHKATIVLVGEQNQIKSIKAHNNQYFIFYRYSSMTTDSNDLTAIKATIDSKKVGDIVIDALQEILPHVRGASTADIMMAYAVMIKSTLIGMELTEVEKDQAKALFDQMWPEVLVDRLVATRLPSSSIH